MTDATVGAVVGAVLADADPEGLVGYQQVSVLGVPMPTEGSVLNAYVSVLGDPSPTHSIVNSQLVSVLGVLGEEVVAGPSYLRSVGSPNFIKRKIDGLWEPVRIFADGGAAPVVEEHSIWGGANPAGVYNAYQDGAGIWLGDCFYIAPGYDIDLAASTVKAVGMRLWVEAVSPGDVSRGQLWPGTANSAADVMSGTPLAEQTTPQQLAPGWNDLMFDVPYEITQYGQSLLAAYRGFGVGNIYYYAGTGNPRAGAPSSEGVFHALDGSGLVMAEYGSALQVDANGWSYQAGWYRYDGSGGGNANGNSSVTYATDLIIEVTTP